MDNLREMLETKEALHRTSRLPKRPWILSPMLLSKPATRAQVKIAMDVASSEFYKTEEKKYDLDFKNPDSDKSKWVTLRTVGRSIQTLG